MRGNNDTPQSFWYGIDLEELMDADHPLRAIKRMVNEVPAAWTRTFGRPTPTEAADRSPCHVE
jgi:hypothetical protein